MAASANKTVWALLMYIKECPHTSIKWQELHEIASMFIAENVTGQTLTAATALTHANEGLGVVDFSTDITFPAYAAATRVSADAGGTAASTTLAANKLILANAMYPGRGI